MRIGLITTLLGLFLIISAITSCMKKEEQYLFILVYVFAFSCSAQDTSFELSNKEINTLIAKIDTLSGNRNYHVLLMQDEDEEIIQVYIWINDRLGDSMFKEAGMSICKFYMYKRSPVFIYEYKKCEYLVPSSYMREISSDPYSYLTESPFYVENGFQKAFIVKRKGKDLIISDLEILENNNIIDDITKLIDGDF
jgi:hypothetical protein